MPQPVLTTNRLVMYPLAPHHLEMQVELDSDVEVMRYLSGRASTRAEIEVAHARRIGMARKVEGLGCWMAFEVGPSGPGLDSAAEQGRFVGLVMLPPAHGPDQPDDLTVADLGYRLVRRAWGRGFAREAGSRLLEHAFDPVGMSRVIAQTRSDNDSSRRLLEAIGMRYVRTFRSLSDESDGPPDVEYEMTAHGWTHCQPR